MKILLYSIILLSFPTFAQNQSDCLNQNLHKIETFEPDTSSDDLAFVKGYIKDRDIVSLGESTHGSKEVFQLKHRIIKYLVAECDFTVFAIEANMVECSLLNNYIQTGKGNPEQLLARLGYWVWNTQEVLDLIVWMRDYNTNHSNQIQFTGFDMQSYFYSLYKINEFTTNGSINNSEYLNNINQIDTVIRANQMKGVYQVSDSLREKMYTNSAKLQAELKTLYSNKTNGYANLIQYSKLLLQYATRYSINKPEHGYRDSCMAQNLQWIKEQNPNSKIVVWAHNGHVKKGRYTMGKYMIDLEINPYVIGFSTNEGEYNAISNGEISTNELQIPNDSCYEYYLNQAKPPIYFLDLQSSVNKCDFLSKEMMFREIGSMSREEQFFESFLIEEYDAIIHVRKTKGAVSLY
jgi:erythromycin esterase